VDPTVALDHCDVMAGVAVQLGLNGMEKNLTDLNIIIFHWL